MHKIMYNLRLCWLTVSYPFRKTSTANVCGHRTKKTGEVTTYGESHTVSMPLSENGKPDYCLDCIGKMSILCAWCRKSIHVGEPITLYVPHKSFKIPEHAVRYSEDESCLVGCLRWDCASGGDRQGFWIPPGKVRRVPSPIEMIMSNEGEAKMIIVENLSDPNDLGTFV